MSSIFEQLNCRFKNELPKLMFFSSTLFLNSRIQSYIKKQEFVSGAVHKLCNAVRGIEGLWRGRRGQKLPKIALRNCG